MQARYLGKRLLFAILTLFVVISLNFALFRAVPGDAANAYRCRQCGPEFRAQIRKDLRLDESLPHQYVAYMGDLAHGNLGRSLRSQGPVWDELWNPIKKTIPMVLLGTIFSIVVGTLIGVVAAWRRGTFIDKASVSTALAFYSMPPQWLGLLMVLFVAGAVGLPSSGVQSNDLGLFGDASGWSIFVDRIEHMILPALTLGLVLAGDYALIVRTAMLETLGEDYILTARAKGISPFAIVCKHGLRNALLPITTLITLSLGLVIGGTITIEYVFSYPGIGLRAVEAIDQKDFPVLQGAFLLIALSVILFNLLADLLYPKIDPRVTS